MSRDGLLEGAGKDSKSSCCDGISKSLLNLGAMLFYGVIAGHYAFMAVDQYSDGMSSSDSDKSAREHYYISILVIGVVAFLAAAKKRYDQGKASVRADSARQTLTMTCMILDLARRNSALDSPLASSRAPVGDIESAGERKGGGHSFFIASERPHTPTSGVSGSSSEYPDLFATPKKTSTSGVSEGSNEKYPESSYRTPECTPTSTVGGANADYLKGILRLNPEHKKTPGRIKEAIKQLHEANKTTLDYSSLAVSPSLTGSQAGGGAMSDGVVPEILFQPK